jgi:glucose-1-phosphate adenylyltransferase
MQAVLGFILGGGRGAGLYPLTRLRSAPAVPIAGKYRLIDIPISNCINSGVQRIYVLTQFLSVSLHRHIANTYKFAPFSNSFVEVLAAQQTNEAADWYQGTADALRQNLRYLNADGARDLLILSGDGLYRMNYADLVKTHRQTGADITMAVVPVRRTSTSNLGIVRLDDNNRLIDLVEKPRTHEQLEMLRAPAGWLQQRNLAGAGKEYLANMGIYVCKREMRLIWSLSTSPASCAAITSRPISSRSIGRTLEPSATTTKPISLWLRTIHPLISTIRTASSTPACATCLLRRSAPDMWKPA